eukprot:g13116.t1
MGLGAEKVSEEPAEVTIHPSAETGQSLILVMRHHSEVQEPKWLSRKHNRSQEDDKPGLNNNKREEELHSKRARKLEGPPEEKETARGTTEASHMDTKAQQEPKRGRNREEKREN